MLPAPLSLSLSLTPRCSYNVVALDFLGHGDSPAPNEPRLYTADEVGINSEESISI